MRTRIRYPKAAKLALDSIELEMDVIENRVITNAVVFSDLISLGELEASVQVESAGVPDEGVLGSKLA